MENLCLDSLRVSALKRLMIVGFQTKPYFKIAAGNPTLFVPRDVTKMKCSTLAEVAAWKTGIIIA